MQKIQSSSDVSLLNFKNIKFSQKQTEVYEKDDDHYEQ